jgi:hypothetical protein
MSLYTLFGKYRNPKENFLRCFGANPYIARVLEFLLVVLILQIDKRIILFDDEGDLFYKPIKRIDMMIH